MSLMFRNTNKALEKELAAEDYKAHPVRNRLAILAVALCAILLSVTFSIGIGLVQTLTRAMGASPGPGADSNAVYGDEEIYEKVCEQPQVDWAAYVRRCSSTRLHNLEFQPLDIYLLAADEVHYDKNKVELIIGKYPEKADEILLSDTLSGRLGLEEQIGVSYLLKVVVERDGEQVEEEIPMTVCGYYRNPIKNCADIYEEIYTGESFVETYNPELPGGYDTIYVKLNNLNFLSFGYDKGQKLSDLNTMVGGNGTQYKASNMTLTVIIPMLLVVVCIMFCGYFFIYNIFDISIVNDIRFYGELKTIGTTARQLRRMLLWQMNRIAFYGIIFGGLAGGIIGQSASGWIVAVFAENIAMYYQPAGVVESFLAGSVFAWLTLLISTLKPFRIACTISPVEAVRYRAKRKKGAFSVISFALSGTLFLVIYTLSMGFSAETQTMARHDTDFQVRHKGIMWMQDEPFVPISQGVVEDLRELEFVQDFSIYYIARTKPDYIEYGGNYRYYTSAEITTDGEIAKDQLAYLKSVSGESGYGARADYSVQADHDGEQAAFNDRGNLPINVAGMDTGGLENEMKCYAVLEGSIDSDEFSKGGYLVYLRDGADSNRNQDEDMEYTVHAGDEVTVTFYDDVADCYVDRNFTVMAIIMNQDPYGKGNAYQSNIWLTQEDFWSVYSDYENLVGAISFNCADYTKDGKAISEQEKQEIVEEVLREDGNLQLMLDSVYQDRVYFIEMKRTITVFGAFLVVIVGLIGIANIINTVTTDVMARQVEYAAMQSIGMTGKQMQKDIFTKYAVYVLGAAGVATAAGAAISGLIGTDLLFNFSLAALIQAVAIFLMFAILLCVVMAQTLTKVMNRKSVVERLRAVV